MNTLRTSSSIVTMVLENAVFIFHEHYGDKTVCPLISLLLVDPCSSWFCGASYQEDSAMKSVLSFFSRPGPHTFLRDMIFLLKADTATTSGHISVTEAHKYLRLPVASRECDQDRMFRSGPDRMFSVLGTCTSLLCDQ